MSRTLAPWYPDRNITLRPALRMSSRREALLINGIIRTYVFIRQTLFHNGRGEYFAESQAKDSERRTSLAVLFFDLLSLSPSPLSLLFSWGMLSPFQPQILTKQ